VFFLVRRAAADTFVILFMRTAHTMPHAADSQYDAFYMVDAGSSVLRHVRAVVGEGGKRFRSAFRWIARFWVGFRWAYPRLACFLRPYRTHMQCPPSRAGRPILRAVRNSQSVYALTPRVDSTRRELSGASTGVPLVLLAIRPGTGLSGAARTSFPWAVDDGPVSFDLCALNLFASAWSRVIPAITASSPGRLSFRGRARRLAGWPRSHIRGLGSGLRSLGAWLIWGATAAGALPIIPFSAKTPQIQSSARALRGGGGNPGVGTVVET